MPITFESSVQEASFYSPLADFEEVTTEVEVREDPLTGQHARVVSDNFLMPEEEPDIDEVVGDSEGCFFCPERVSDVTPEYPDWVGFDRGSVGEATSFPNLNPYGAHSNVVVLTEDHYVPIGEFTADIFADGLQAAMDYVGAVFEHDADARYASVNMNFLRPAGSSIVHPHVQTLVDERGTNAQTRRVDAAREYRDANDSSYWADLLDAELDGERHVGTTGGVEWLAPFAPGHHRHVQGIAAPTAGSAPEGDLVSDVAEGVVNVLQYYDEVGLNSFNFTLQLASHEPAVPPVVDVVARSVFEEFYWSDSTFFTVLHDESVVDVAPEEYGPKAAEHF